MKLFKFLLFLVISLTIFYLLNFHPGMIPPLGKFLSPFAGFWQNNTNLDKIPEVLDIDGLKDTVVVRWDARRVPHVFANNDYDLYFAQGYLTARDRLWQMEFQTHAAAGRISEIVGEKALEFDRFRRRIGILYAAENTLHEVMKNPKTRTVIEAYADGINAYIRSLNRKNYPLEYKILDYEPEEWTPLKTALLLKYMAWDLTGYNIQELFLTHANTTLSKSEMDRLHPNYPPFTDPIIPPEKIWDFTPLIPKKPELPNSGAMKRAAGVLSENKNISISKRAGFCSLCRWIKNITQQPGFLDRLVVHQTLEVHESDLFRTVGRKGSVPFMPEINIGSNNWAVSGRLTASGYPILCNDPHLHLTLPSIWYEIQLVSPTVNVYGVTLPGAPSVIIGFNSKVSWGLTNAETDVIDWYEIEFKDQSNSAYLYDGEWRPTTRCIEEIKVRGTETMVDTVYYTHHGPVVYHTNELPFNRQIPRGTAMRWTAHDPSNELLTFLQLNRASNYDDYVKAISLYNCPGQNFAFASADGDIAIWHNGKFPLRWHGQGRIIHNGRKAAYEWQDWIPRSHLPHIKNPARGFVSSANQYPTTSDYPYYMNGNYAPFMRSTRINKRLADLQAITPQDMMMLQNDVINLHAQKALPVMLTALDEAERNINEDHALRYLKTWNYENRADLIAPTIFEYWWNKLSDLIWKDELGYQAGNLPVPRRDVTLALILNDPESPYFDKRTSLEKEKFQDIAANAFHLTINTLADKFGDFGPAWEWGTAQGTDIRHLAQIPGLGRLGLSTDGNFGIVNAISRYHGPSWRMVVAFAVPLQAWGIYPGGQSGNPGSQFYDHTVDDWVAGKMYELIYLKSSKDTHELLIGKTIMK